MYWEKTRLSTSLSGHMRFRVLRVSKSILVHADGVRILTGSNISLLYFLVPHFAPALLTSISKDFAYDLAIFSLRKLHRAVFKWFYYTDIIHQHSVQSSKFLIFGKYGCIDQFQSRNPNCEKKIWHVLAYLRHYMKLHVRLGSKLFDAIKRSEVFPSSVKYSSDSSPLPTEVFISPTSAPQPSPL